MKITPFILSGGSGKRLWPLSRSLFPKQFIKINNKNSYFQDVLSRVNDKKIYNKANIICNIENRFLVKDQSNEIDIQLDKIILEPTGKNTAASAIVSAFYSKKEELILLLPSDHVINNKKRFNESIKKGIDDAVNGNIVLFGIKPDSPETGYGYISIKNNIKNKSFLIEKFIEKPDLQNAKKLYKKNNIFWNSGIFLFKSSTILSESENYCPSIMRNVKYAKKNQIIDHEYNLLDLKEFNKIKPISIDYSIIQKSKLLKMCKLDVKWSDMGSWESYWKNHNKDKNNNFIAGKNINENCENSLIFSDKQFTVTSGLKDLIVASISDSLLVMKKSESNNLSRIIDKLDPKKYNEIEISTKSFRPWGSYEILKESSNFKVKELTINPKSSISLQKHIKRSEHWIVVEGEVIATKGKREIKLKKNRSIDIKAGEIHRLKNNSNKQCKIIEVQTGNYLGEDDIIRYEDTYNRN
jgi:mannose-1-phosphate guanylyltransferase